MALETDLTTAIIGLGGTLAGAFIGILGTNWFNAKNAKKNQETERDFLRRTLSIRSAAFRVTVNSKRNMALEGARIEEDRGEPLPDSYITSLKCDLPNFLEVNNTGVSSFSEGVVGNIENVRQIWTRNNQLVEAVIAERANDQILYDKPLGDIALNYNSMSDLLGSIVESLDGQRD